MKKKIAIKIIIVSIMILYLFISPRLVWMAFTETLSGFTFQNDFYLTKQSPSGSYEILLSRDDASGIAIILVFCKKSEWETPCYLGFVNAEPYGELSFEWYNDESSFRIMRTLGNGSTIPDRSFNVPEQPPAFYETKEFRALKIPCLKVLMISLLVAFCADVLALIIWLVFCIVKKTKTGKTKHNQKVLPENNNA